MYTVVSFHRQYREQKSLYMSLYTTDKLSWKQQSLPNLHGKQANVLPCQTPESKIATPDFEQLQLADF